MTHDQRLAARAVLSGLLSYGLPAFLDRLFGDHGQSRLLPGLIFGALVLAPEAAPGPRRRLRQALAAAGSVLIYWLAVRLAVHEIIELHWRDLPACALSGFLGAVAAGLAARFTLPRDIGPSRLTQAAFAGAISGALFGLKGTFGIPSNLEVCTLAAGFLAWQTSVALLLLRDEPRP